MSDTVEYPQDIHWNDTHVAGFIYNGNFLCKRKKVQDDDGNWRTENVTLCRRIQVLYLQRDVDSNELTAKLAFRFRDEDIAISVGLLQLSSKEISTLSRYGFSVKKQDEVAVASFLAEQIQVVPMYTVHRSLGFQEFNGYPIYLHEKAIGIESSYQGDLPIKASGTYDAWYTIVSEEVIPHTPAVIPLIIGFAALLIGFLSLYRPVQSIIAHFWGRHGTGKTTAEFIALSIFGMPSERSGLLLPWNSTANSLVASLRNCYGVCFGFDDSSTAGAKDLSSILYTVANNQERKRMTKDLGIRASASWAVSVVSSGEVDILEFGQKTSGLEDRVLRFQNLPITKDALHADKLQMVLSRNYGFAAPVFANYLLQMGIDGVEESIQSAKAEIVASEGSEDISSRHRDKLAILLATGKLCAECFGFAIDHPSLERALLENEFAGKAERNIGRQAYDIACDFVESNYKRFHYDKDRAIGSGCYGKILFVRAATLSEESEGYEYHSRIYFIRSVLDDLLKRKGYLNPKQIYSEWKEMGLLYTNESSHLGVKEKSLGKNRAIAITIPYMVGDITDDKGDVQYPGPNDGQIDF